MTAAVAAAEPLVIPGPAGAIEALLEEPVPARPDGFAVICHPHPLHGGTMQNKVVHTLARVFQELGLPTLRFNYRGVGASAGGYDNGRGETEDALAVIAYGQRRWPVAAVSLAGFSFGALVALRASARVPPARLVNVAPAVGRPEAVPLRRPDCPWLIVQGDADEIVDYRQVQTFAQHFVPPPRLQILAGVDHFFHGRLHELHDAVIAFSREETR
ncbi:MAG TPA: alpha/beta hydrolase [Steroidobacteraceae bacterium]|nr:alpha/beta hydrolase [Steroidobacteraceae bacterium]